MLDDLLAHPDRTVPLQGASNFRDLGGYPGHDGRPVRWRRLFRSDHLAALSDADLQQLNTLGVAQVFDFRGVHERAALPNRLPEQQQVSLAIEPSVVQRMQDLRQAGQTLTVPLVSTLMEDLYRMLVNEQSHRYAMLFQRLLDSDAPAVFHCTAGKDRTGFAAALILDALGVSRQLIVQDYLLTNKLYQRPLHPQPGISDEALAVLWQVQASFLQAAFDAVDSQHGGMQRYQRERLGLTPAALNTLAARYLTAA